MTQSQKLQLRLSEIREKLNHLAGIETDLTEEQSNEASALQDELKSSEVKFRAALASEAEEKSKAIGEAGHNGDGQPAEVRALLDKASLNDYLSRAAAGKELSGAALELASALDSKPVGPGGGICVPWELLLDRVDEQRAATDTGDLSSSIMQRPIFERLFAESVMSFLGCRMDSVTSGRPEYVVLDDGLVPQQKAENVDADEAVSGSFSQHVLRPTRITGKYFFTHELQATVSDIEAALRRDMASAVASRMSHWTINGDSTADAAQIDGFLVRLAAADVPTTETTYNDYSSVSSQGVDGIYATWNNQVCNLMGISTYQHAESVFGPGTDESGAGAMMRRSAATMASAYIPAPSSGGVQNGNILHSRGMNAGGPMHRADSIIATWSHGLELVRDVYSDASTGVHLTWIALWAARLAHRPAAYRRWSSKNQ